MLTKKALPILLALLFTLPYPSTLYSYTKKMGKASSSAIKSKKFLFAHENLIALPEEEERSEHEEKTPIQKSTQPTLNETQQVITNEKHSLTQEFAQEQ